MSNSARTTLPEWKELQAHQKVMKAARISTLFQEEPERNAAFSYSCADLTYNFSYNCISEETLRLLVDLARACGLEDSRADMFNGVKINNTEDRAALHPALRLATDPTLEVDGKNIHASVEDGLAALKTFSASVQATQDYTDIVNIGVGGSDTGPNLVYDALKTFSDRAVNMHFLSNVDPAHASEVLRTLNPHTTLFIVASKSFGTQETFANASIAKEWAMRMLGDKWTKAFVAVTAKPEAAKEFGLEEHAIFSMPDWAGGRFSLWSAIGLSIAIAIGYDNFEALLNGARAADTHFFETPLEKNIPVLHAMIGVWHRNFWDYTALCILPYNQDLHLLPRYVQQLDMESNGKTVDREGKAVDYATSPVVFGEVGTNAQHAFFQLLHQGTDIVPCEFVAARTSIEGSHEQYKLLISNILGQRQAFRDGQANAEEPHKNFEGNRPSTSIWLNEMTPYNLGMLLAFYEHKTFVQGVIWNLNSFDQWGVELGKVLSKNVLQTITT